MKRILTRRSLFIAVALLTLVSQAAVASHVPGHDEETVSKCQDGSKHFCSEVPAESSDRCVLCQVSAGGIALSFQTLSESTIFAEPVPVVDRTGPRSVLKFSPTSPRAPPSLPA